MFVFRLSYVVAAMALTTPAFAEQQPTSGPSAQSNELRIISVDCHRQSLQQIIDENLDAYRLRLDVSGHCGGRIVVRRQVLIVGSPSLVLEALEIRSLGVSIDDAAIIGSADGNHGLTVIGGSAYIRNTKILFEPRNKQVRVVATGNASIAFTNSFIASPIAVMMQSKLTLSNSRVVSGVATAIQVTGQSLVRTHASHIVRKDYQPYPVNCNCGAIVLHERSSLIAYATQLRGRIQLSVHSMSKFIGSTVRGELMVHSSSIAEFRNFTSYRGKSMVAGRRSFIDVISGDDVVGEARCQRGGRITGQTAGLVLTDCPLP